MLSLRYLEPEAALKVDHYLSTPVANDPSGMFDPPRQESSCSRKNPRANK